MYAWTKRSILDTLTAITQEDLLMLAFDRKPTQPVAQPKAKVQNRPRSLATPYPNPHHLGLSVSTDARAVALRPATLQRKPIVNLPGDIHEHESDTLSNRLGTHAEGKAEQKTQGVGHKEMSDLSRQPGGIPLPDHIQRAVSAATGANLSGVRVHVDANSARVAHTLDARAFTIGQNIHFGHGEYRPGTRNGDLRIMHEVVHTLQDRLAGPETGAFHRVSRPSDSHEREASVVARKIFAHDIGTPARRSGDLRVMAPRVAAPRGVVHRDALPSSSAEMSLAEGASDASTLESTAQHVPLVEKTIFGSAAIITVDGSPVISLATINGMPLHAGAVNLMAKVSPGHAEIGVYCQSGIGFYVHHDNIRALRPLTVNAVVRIPPPRGIRGASDSEAPSTDFFVNTKDSEQKAPPPSAPKPAPRTRSKPTIEPKVAAKPPPLPQDIASAPTPPVQSAIEDTPPSPVASMDTSEKMEEVLKRTLPHLPEATVDVLRELFTTDNMVLLVMLMGAGQAAAFIGSFLLGMQTYALIQELTAAYNTTIAATSEEELESAANKLAHAAMNFLAVIVSLRGVVKWVRNRGKLPIEGMEEGKLERGTKQRQELGKEKKVDQRKQELKQDEDGVRKRDEEARQKEEEARKRDEEARQKEEEARFQRQAETLANELNVPAEVVDPLLRALPEAQVRTKGDLLTYLSKRSGPFLPRLRAFMRGADDAARQAVVQFLEKRKPDVAELEAVLWQIDDFKVRNPARLASYYQQVAGKPWLAIKLAEGRRSVLNLQKEGVFAKLGTDFEVIGPEDSEYNCISHSVGKKSGPLNPKLGPPQEPLLEMDDIYKSYGYERQNRTLGEPLDISEEPGVTKVVLYGHIDANGKLDIQMHAAVQDGKGGWTSKLGPGPLIHHPKVESVGGPPGEGYGRPIAVYKKK